MKVYFAADHAGFELKNTLMNFVRGELGHDVEDCGAYELDASDDYPDFIAKAARAVSEDTGAGRESAAIVIGASGQGEAMAVNRFKGVRCALYYGPAPKTQTDMSGHTLDMIESTRAHNWANALSLGARFLTQEEAEAAVKKWLSIPPSSEERHERRVKKLDVLE